MKGQGNKRTRTLSVIHTILLLGKDQERLKTIAQRVVAPGRIVIMACSKQAMRTVFDFETVRLTIVDVDNADELAKVVPALKRKQDMPLVLIRDEQPTAKPRRKGVLKPSISTITKPVSPPSLEQEIAPLLN